MKENRESAYEQSAGSSQIMRITFPADNTTYSFVDYQRFVYFILPHTLTLYFIYYNI